MKFPVIPDTRAEQPRPSDPFAGSQYSDHPACLWATADKTVTLGSQQWFSARESERIARMKSPQRRQQLFASFALRRRLIAELTGCTPEDVRLTALEGGAPALNFPSGWTVSLANKGAVTAIAIDRLPEEIGIDLEFVRPLNWRSMLGMVSSEAERDAFTQVYAKREDSAEAFLRLWTLKEAVLKATQQGFRAGPQAVETPPPIIQGPGQGQLLAFGARFDFWTARHGNALISLVRKHA